MIETQIKKILIEWNPLEVPEIIVESEYLDYIPEIISRLNDKDLLRTYLINLLGNTMGLNISNDKILSEIDLYTEKFYILK